MLTALVRMLRVCATTARDEAQRIEIARQAALVLETMDLELITPDAEEMRGFAHRLDLALSGNLDDAFGDRAGESRSV